MARMPRSEVSDIEHGVVISTWNHAQQRTADVTDLIQHN
jgi:hypothetical protein